MATTLDAILRIAAQVTGTNRITALSDELNRAGKESKGLQRSSVGLAGGLGTLQGQLAGLLSATALLGFGVALFKAGNEAQMLDQRLKTLTAQYGETAQVQQFAAEAAKRYGLGIKTATEGVVDLYARLKPMGVSMENIKIIFDGLNTSARSAGLGLHDVKEAARQLGQAMGSGRLQGDELRSLLERLPGLADAISQAFNNIAKAKGLQLITKERSDQLLKTVKESEVKQTEILKEQLRERQYAFKKEVDARLKQIARQYREIERSANEAFDDQAAAEEDRQQQLRDERISQINESIELEKKAITRKYEDISAVQLSSEKNLSEAERTAIQRRIEDSRELELKAIQERGDQQLKEEEKIANQNRKAYTRRQQKIREERLDQIKDQQDSEESIVKKSLDRQLNQLQAINKKQLTSIKESTKAIQAEILARTIKTAGDIKKLGEEGKISIEVMIEAMKIKGKDPMPAVSAFQTFVSEMENLMTKLGKDFEPLISRHMPTIIEFIKNLADLLKYFYPVVVATVEVLAFFMRMFNSLASVLKNLPPGLKEFVDMIGYLGAAFVAVKVAILPAIGLITGLFGLFAGGGAAGAGGVAAAVGGVGALQGALLGLLGWIGTAFVPGIVALFSGPVGWITLVVAAVGGLIFLFRKPIGDLIGMIAGQFKIMTGNIDKSIKEIPTPEIGIKFKKLEPELSDFVNNVKTKIDELISSLFIKQEIFFEKIKQNIENLPSTAIDAMLNNAKNKISQFFQSVKNQVNIFIDALNDIFGALRRIARYDAVRAIPRNLFELIRSLLGDNDIPRMASGGYARQRSIVEIAEAGQGEYAIPDNRMARASLNYLQGARGVDVLNRTPSNVGGQATVAPKITLNIKPNIIQKMDGNYVTFEEAMAIAQQASMQTALQIMQPEARLAYGL